MSVHGNYRRLHWTEAVAEAKANDEILVTTDSVLVVNQGSEAAVAIHIVGGPKFWEQDEPQAYEVQLIRPRWLYGNEGHLHPVRWVAWVDELTDAELDAISDDDPYWDLIPEGCAFLWAVPKVPKFSSGKPWQRCEIAWWKPFREVQP